MIRALYSGTTGMRGQQLQLDTISNNLANVNTAGFKKSRVQFEDLYYQEMRAVGVETVDGGQVPSGIQVGLGVIATSTQKQFTQGSIHETGNDLDLAIEGRGFFQVIRDGEEFYTRSGNFTRDADGFIVTQNGDRLQPEFAIPADTVILSVGADGLIQAKNAAQEIIAEGQLTLHNFINPGGLRAEGGNLFRPTEASGDPIESDPGTDGAGVILQNFIEVSNVDVTEELVNLIITQRAFEMNSKSVQTADQLLEVANTLKR
ncbi:flagellar basal-body rod protein FlgG [Desulfurivibrio dismutans]|uniref:flagellar basal-body rod protein FlgG n=1 Tax=Desulfurivibrio dismutans TaxID=1398908 RepID=UPI0023DB1F1A|nr:flagellar basal-body rod protein FlgG [Desulfurivibrio alkaliphilus]MDF1615419.1 flagellar basal-body rod protein FlgG [Desulfurivibrio alkaliphilus]